MVKVVLLLLIAASLILFAIQNQAPFALVVLGTKTPALPLAAWVLGSLTAGAFTTLLLTGFSSLSKAGAVRRASQRVNDAGTPPSPWGGVGTKRGTAAANETPPKSTFGFKAAPSEPQPSRGPNRRKADDWETSDREREVWDDWGEPEPPQQRTAQSTSKTNLRNPTDSARVRWEDEPPTDSPATRHSRLRTDSIEQPAADRRDSLDNPSNRSNSERGRSERSSEVYDAEYRVLIPPYNAPPPAAYNPAYNPSPPPSASPSPEPDPLDDDDDWGLDDLNLKK